MGGDGLAWHSLTVFVVAALSCGRGWRVRRCPRSRSSALIDTTANVAFATAATLGLLSLVAVLSSLYPVVTVGLAHLGQGERLAAGQWLGVALALTGVILITA